MHALPTCLLGSVLFAVAGCSTANPSGTAAYRAPGGPGGAGEAGGATAGGDAEGTTDPGVRLFGAEPMGALVVETMPSVRRAPAGAGDTAPAAIPAPGFAAPQGTGRRAPPPPPPPRLPVTPPAEPTPGGTRIPPPPPPPAAAATAAPDPTLMPWPAQPYPPGTGAPPMPAGSRTESGVLGPPPAGELPPPEARRVAR